MDQIMLIMLLIAMAVIGWTVIQNNVRSSRLAKKPVPVERDHVEKRKVL